MKRFWAHETGTNRHPIWGTVCTDCKEVVLASDAEAEIERLKTELAEWKKEAEAAKAGWLKQAERDSAESIGLEIERREKAAFIAGAIKAYEGPEDELPTGFVAWAHLEADRYCQRRREGK